MATAQRAPRRLQVLAQQVAGPAEQQWDGDLGRGDQGGSALTLTPKSAGGRTLPPELGRAFDVVVVGSGFSGLVTAILLRNAGKSVRVFEKGTDVGGTWFWNRYPGCACDVESVYYSYSFDTDLEQEWVWPMRYSNRDAIFSYARHVAMRFDVYDLIRFSTEVVSCRWNEEACSWTVGTDCGDEVSCRHLVLAIGALSMPRLPSAPGLDSFGGRVLHTARWPEGAAGDMNGLRVGLVGTGATAVQILPEIAERCSQVYVFQRTPATVRPRKNRDTDLEALAEFKKSYPDRRRWFRDNVDVYWDDINDPASNGRMMEKLRSSIRATVRNQRTAEVLCPNYVFGCKRPCIHDGYYEAFNLPNVELVDVSGEAGLQEFCPEGPRHKGRTFPVDVLIFATGFDAMGGGNYARCGIRGVKGISLEQKWQGSSRPKSLYGIHVAGFPNMYILHGPHSPSVLSNMIQTAEIQARHIVAAILRASELPRGRIETTEAAEDQWYEMSQDIGLQKVQSQCLNWYNKGRGSGGLQIYTGNQKELFEMMEQDQSDGFCGPKFRCS